MDISCPRCGEPWENDTFHEVASEKDSTYRQVTRDFGSRGCVVITGQRCERDDSERTQVAAMLFDLLGDDTDGIAAMMDDYEMGY